MSDFFSDLLALGKKVVEASEVLQTEIDKHSSKERSTGGPASASSTAVADEAATTSRSSPQYSSLYLRHLSNGCPNPLQLLTRDEASRIMDCVVELTTTGEEEYIGVHYGCADDRSMYVSLSVSALMPWDYVTNEVTSQLASHSVGDEALVAGEMLYVRKGQHFFWLYGRGVDERTIYRVATHVAERLPG